MWFIGVEVEQETSAPPPKKILHPPLQLKAAIFTFFVKNINQNLCYKNDNNFAIVWKRLKRSDLF